MNNEAMEAKENPYFERGLNSSVNCHRGFHGDCIMHFCSCACHVASRLPARVEEAARPINKVDPCPFCGSEPEETHSNDKDYFYVGCANEDCMVQPETGLCQSEGAARKAWNWKTLAPSPIPSATDDIRARYESKSSIVEDQEAFTEATPSVSGGIKLPEELVPWSAVRDEMSTSAIHYLEQAQGFLANSARMNDAPLPYMVAAAFKVSTQLRELQVELNAALKEIAELRTKLDDAVNDSGQASEFAQFCNKKAAEALGLKRDYEQRAEKAEETLAQRDEEIARLKAIAIELLPRAIEEHHLYVNSMRGTGADREEAQYKTDRLGDEFARLKGESK